MKKNLYLFISSLLLLAKLNYSEAQSWSLLGNAGTTPGTNFLGTTDNKSLVFKTNNSEQVRILSNGNVGVGIKVPLQKFDVNGNININSGFALYIENHPVLKVDSVYQNVFLGNGSAFNTVGIYNTGTGFYSLAFNTIGSSNTATGSYSLYKNTTGSGNTANGLESLLSNITGGSNTAMGEYSLHSNINGFNNTACGQSALSLNTTGNNNTGIGGQALFSNTTGSSNTAYGSFALMVNKTGYSNVAIGTGSLHNNADRSNIVAVGDSALYNNSTGTTISYQATQNTAIGSKALYGNRIGHLNTAIGFQTLKSNNTGTKNTASGGFALFSNLDGYENTANGYETLYANVSGNYNTVSGNYALSGNTGGSKNTATGCYAGNFNNLNNNCSFFGFDANQSVTTDFTNSTAIGNTSRITASNQVRIGNASVSSIGGQVGWSTLSDGRYKKEIKNNVPGLAFVNKLKPVTYHIDVNGIKNFLQEDSHENITLKKDAVDNDERALTEKGIKEKTQTLYTGFIAQDVEKAAAEIGYDFSGVDAPKNENDLYGLRYGDFVVPLVKAVQELSNSNDVKDARIDALQKQNEDLKKQFADLRSLVLSIQQCSPCNLAGAAVQTYTTTITEGASLEQNSPNPFNHNTSIGYTLPEKFTTAQIIITDNNGRTLKAVNVSGAGKGSLNVDASVLASGAYNYSLYVDGKLIGTKQMLLAK